MMPAMTTWEQWMEATIPARLTPRAIARAIDGDNKSVGRWLAAAQPPAEFVIRLARAFDSDPVRALVAAGYLRDDEAVTVGLNVVLASATDLQLAAEMYSRIRRGETGVELTDEEIAERGRSARTHSGGGGGTERGSPEAGIQMGRTSRPRDDYLTMLDETLSDAEQDALLTRSLHLAGPDLGAWDGRERRRGPGRTAKAFQTGPTATYKTTVTTAPRTAGE